ncbi:MAG: alginate export family protein [Cyclobacteriaceae bacterium]|nr:alginate export family protein [Cyclobacteriaceae bacterium]MDX5468067.1 alginate export family protein [Cyclobacteriaceae bacterium]
MKSNVTLVGLAVLSLLVPLKSFAQFTVDGQILVRSEYRNGYNLPIAEGMDPAGFIAHRARLQAGYKMDQFTFYMSVQDVRTWGSTPQANISDDFLSLHEAWGEVSVGERWKIKLGRQELNYDNFRFLGNLDWALQARSHDFALVKYEKEKMKLHMGGGFNQDSQKLSGNLYTIPNQYRTAQLIRYENVLGKVDFSLLFWNEGRQWTTKDANGVVTDQGVRFRQTLGIPSLKTTIKNTTLSGYFYSQFGKDVAGKKVSAFNASGQISQALMAREDGKRWRATAGYELISGTNASGSERNNSFTLQYGTNHLYNGYIDWFFVGNTWENSVGLKDLFIRSRYEFSPKIWVQTDWHSFSAYAETILPTETGISEKSKNLGSELDFTFGWILQEAVSIQGGYSQYFLSDTMRSLQVGQLQNQQNWAYLMVVFRPTSKAKFIGVLQ